MVQRSKDEKRMEELQGLNGETCYCLITDHHTGALFLECFTSKAPPLDFLNRWLARYGLPCGELGKYVCMDQGGELAQCREIVELFENAQSSDGRRKTPDTCSA